VEIHPQECTHNRFFENEGELVGTLTRVFGDMQTHPELIRLSSLFLLTLMSLYLCAAVSQVLDYLSSLPIYRGRRKYLTPF
jgi:hypothetical protein